mmetsp:Transcript_13015/g.28516  ORF Transcript_13015/g.28516 Transcript_13015/m.28516 type:complete len:218 (+) Transcript_13015:20-673(+)
MLQAAERSFLILQKQRSCIIFEVVTLRNFQQQFLSKTLHDLSVHLAYVLADVVWAFEHAAAFKAFELSLVDLFRFSLAKLPHFFGQVGVVQCWDDVWWGNAGLLIKIRRQPASDSIVVALFECEGGLLQTFRPLRSLHVRTKHGRGSSLLKSDSVVEAASKVVAKAMNAPQVQDSKVESFGNVLGSGSQNSLRASRWNTRSRIELLNEATGRLFVLL